MVGILNDEQFRKTLKLLEAKVGFETLGEPEVTTLSERQTQMRTGDKKNSGGTALDVTPHGLSDGYTIRLSALITGPEQLTTQANVWDGQALMLSKTEKANPEK